MTVHTHAEEPHVTIYGVNAKSDLGRFLLHVTENPTLYAAGLLLVVVAVFAGLVWRNAVQSSEKTVMTTYAEALVDTEDPAIRATKLETAAQNANGRWSAEVAYMAGEAALAQGTYDKAEAHFNRVLKDFSSSEYVSRAAEGLAYIAESKGDLKAALAAYQDVATKYEKTFTGKLQQNNIGRVQEGLNDFAGAVAAYKKQIEIFPDSRAAAKAQAALDRLKGSHPELFPEEKKAEAAPVVDGAAAPAPAEAAPAEAPAPAPAAQ